MKTIFICSPYRGDVKRNREIARKLCKRVILDGNAPYAPHLYLTDVLDDNDEYQRDLGLRCGLQFLSSCDELLVYHHNGISDGMKDEISFCKLVSKKINYVIEPIKSERLL